MQLVLAAGQERTLQCSGSSRRLCPSVCLFICLFVCIACRNARDLNNYFFSSLTYPFLTTTRRALQYEGARTLCKHYVEKHYHQQAGSVSMRHGARLVSVTRCHRWRAPIPMTRDKGALISVPISLSLARTLSISLWVALYYGIHADVRDPDDSFNNEGRLVSSWETTRCQCKTSSLTA